MSPRKYPPSVSCIITMGFMVDTQKEEGGEHQWSCIRNLVRRKQVDSSNGKAQSHHHHQLAKALTFPHLIAIGNSLSLSLFFLLLKDNDFRNLGFFPS